MASTKTRLERAQESETLATSFEYVLFRDVLYAPVDFETGDDGVIPPPERKSWKPMSESDISAKARSQFDTLFGASKELSDFVFMMKQAAIRADDSSDRLLIKTPAGLKVLKRDGQLHDPDGEFIANTLVPMLNTDATDKALVHSTITDWVGGEEEEATALLRHLATSLAPQWSAGRYVLLIGNGRNGKSLLMQMLHDIFGVANCSGVTRQQMSESDKAVFTLNGKLINLIFDGQAQYLKDSGVEKSLITGESVMIRKLYSNEGSTVKTNALFVEGLNQEPKSRDKTSALQARIVRFWFPNKYPVDPTFEETMRSERYLGAFLSLLIDHYVKRDELAVMLAPTAKSRELQLEHMEENSLGMQFVVYTDETDPMGAEALLGEKMDDLVKRFQSWRIKLNDMAVWEKGDVLKQLKHALNVKRRNVRLPGVKTPRGVYFADSFTEEMEGVLELARGAVEEVDDDVAALVED
jgi:phage/plasmid-associated DNA primase